MEPDFHKPESELDPLKNRPASQYCRQYTFLPRAVVSANSGLSAKILSAINVAQEPTGSMVHLIAQPSLNYVSNTFSVTYFICVVNPNP
jgi:hypothetical protein